MKAIRDLISVSNLKKLLHPVVVMSLSLSFFLWVLIRLSLSYRTVITVEVEYIGMPENMVWTIPPRKTLTVEVQADGWSLLNWKWLRNPDVQVNMSNQNRVGDFLVTQNFRNDIAAQLSAAENLGSIYPDTLRLVSEPLDTVWLETEFEGQIEYAEGFAPSTKIRLTPEKVQVVGPESALAGMKKLYTLPIRLPAVSKDIDRELDWKLGEYVSVLNDSQPRVMVEVDQTTEKIIEVPIQVVHAQRASVFPSTAQVLVSIPISRYERIGEWDFRVEAEIPDAAYQPDYIKLNIAEKPWYAEILELRPQRVEYLVSYD